MELDLDDDFSRTALTNTRSSVVYHTANSAPNPLLVKDLVKFAATAIPHWDGMQSSTPGSAPSLADIPRDAIIRGIMLGLSIADHLVGAPTARHSASRANKQEDLQVLDKSAPLLTKVKGLNSLPRNDETLQMSK